MKLAFTVVVVFLVAHCSPSRQEDQLVPKHGLETRHSVVKRDLSEADIELILKAVMSKMNHDTMDEEISHKKLGVDHEYLHEPRVVSESHLSGARHGTFKHHETFPEEEIGYEVKKDLGASEKDIMSLMMKIKELDAEKALEDSHKKEMYHEVPEEKYISEKFYSSKDITGQGKLLEASRMEDKFADKDVSLAESLYHMKIAGDIETYPNIKLERFSEKLHLDKDPAVLKATADEAYLKKVDEIGKSLLEEGSYKHLKDDDIEEYMKKFSEESKAPFYDPKIVHTETALKSTEEKAIEAWKASHKDLFAAGGEFFIDEKLKTAAPHLAEGHIAHGISDEMMKKLKATLGMDKELGKEDELLLLLSKELHKEAGVEEGTHAYERGKEQAYKDAHIGLSEEEMKKHIEEALLSEKEKVHGTELLFGKGLTDEAFHGINTKLGSGIDKSLHGMIGDEAFKSKEAHALDKSFGFEMDKAKFAGKVPLEREIKHGISHEIPHKHAAETGKDFKIYEEEMLKAYGADSLLHKSFEDEHLKKGKTFGTDEMIHKALEEELKKEKPFGTDMFHKAHEEEFLKKEKGYGTDGMIHKSLEDEFLKKEKAFGTDILHKGHEEDFFKKEKAFGTDGMIHKTLEDELLKKEKAFGTDIHHKIHEEDFLKKEKAYGTDGMIHKALEEELLKKEKAFGTDMYHKGHEEELLKKEKGFETGGVFHKIHDDELVKKEIAYGSDAMFHKNKEILEATGDHHLLHGMKDKELGVIHGVATDKHHVEVKDKTAETEKSPKSFHDLKAKFFELLRRVLHTRKCHLVTMRPGELLGIVNCISRSKDPRLCEKFALCEKKMPSRVIAALEKCQKETIPGEARKCTSHAPLYPSAEIPVKIFQCVAINTRELMPEEKKHMTEFEECARVIKSESCGRFRFLPRPM